MRCAAASGPSPIRDAEGRRGDDREQRVGRAVQQRVLHDERPGQGARGGRVALRSGRLEPHGSAGRQRHGHRQTGHRGVPAQEPAQRKGRDRLYALDRPGLRRDQARGQPLSPQPDPELAEVRVGRPPLPQPTRREHRRPGRRIRVQPLEHRALLGGDPPDPAPQQAQVAQVVAAVLVDAGGPVGAAATARAGQHHAQGGDREHPAEQPRRRVAWSEHSHEPDRAQQHHGRQQPGQHAGRHAPLGLRRRLHQQLAAGQPGWGPRRSGHLDRARRTDQWTAHRWPLPRHEFSRTATAADLALSCFGPGC